MTPAEEAHEIHAELLEILDPVMAPAMAKSFIMGCVETHKQFAAAGQRLPYRPTLMRVARATAAEAPELARKMRKLDREATAYSRGRVAHGENEIEVAPRDEDDPESWRRGWLDAKAEGGESP